MDSLDPKVTGATVKFTPMQAQEVASRVTIGYPESPEQVLRIVTDPAGGVIATLQKETLDALKHFKRFSTMGKLHCWVETLAKEPREKVFKHKHEYRHVVPGMEEAQVKDLLAKLPEMTQRLSKSIAKVERVRFGFAFWVNLGEKIDIEVQREGVTEPVEMQPGDIMAGLIEPGTTFPPNTAENL